MLPAQFVYGPGYSSEVTHSKPESTNDIPIQAPQKKLFLTCRPLANSSSSERRRLQPPNGSLRTAKPYKLLSSPALEMVAKWALAPQQSGKASAVSLASGQVSLPSVVTNVYRCPLVG